MSRKLSFLIRVTSFIGFLVFVLWFLSVRSVGTVKAGGCEAGFTCYVTPTGAGAMNGLDWDNAYADLPLNLTRGVAYFLAGSTTSYGTHTFDDADQGESVITIYKAVDCAVVPSAAYCGKTNPASIAGWRSEYGTNAALWQDAPQPDPQTYTPSFWTFCSNYYVIDGITGTTSPTSGPSGQGFVLRTQNHKNDGLISIGDCPSAAAGLTNISVNHTEIGGIGPMPFYPFQITSCSYANGHATVGINSEFSGVAGDLMAGWDSRNAVIFRNSPVSSTYNNQLVIGTQPNPCSALAWVGLDYFTNSGIFSMNRTMSAEKFTNIEIENCYIHDLANSIELYNVYNVTISGNYLARNRVTPSQHSSMVQFDETDASFTSGPIYLAYNFFLDPVGTAVISHLGQPTRCRTNCGTVKGLYIYGNIFTCDQGAPWYKCGVGQGTVGDNAGETNVQDLVFYNNTVANMPRPQGVALWSANSFGAVIENNLFYNISGLNAVFFQGGSVADTVYDYNTVLNSTLLYLNRCSKYGVCTTHGTADPFVDDANFNFQLVADMNSSPGAGSNKAQGVALAAPYNIDFAGQTRGADGTWERGAYEFASVASQQNRGNRRSLAKIQR